MGVWGHQVRQHYFITNSMAGKNLFLMHICSHGIIGPISYKLADGKSEFVCCDGRYDGNLMKTNRSVKTVAFGED